MGKSKGELATIYLDEMSERTLEIAKAIEDGIDSAVVLKPIPGVDPSDMRGALLVTLEAALIMIQQRVRRSFEVELATEGTEEEWKTTAPTTTKTMN